MSDAQKSNEIRVRFAPSPTGRLHLGGGRTALFNWLFARKMGGTFILRIEDTDKERSKKEFEIEIIEAIKWLGLDWDEGVEKEVEGMKYRQSERSPLYEKYLKELLEKNKAYWCYCSKEDLEAEKELAEAEGRTFKYNGRCSHLTAPPEGKQAEVIRIKNPGSIVSFEDLIRGTVKFDTALLDDFVVAKGLSEPLYNFAVAVDDFDMRISHVIRGEEHISNTPRQIIIQQALGLPDLIYAHLPLVLNAQRAKLSKREADVSLLSYRDKGYLSSAMANFLILMGWHPVHDKEVFTLQELIEEFDIVRVQKAGAVFNEEKLDWLNKEHMKALSDEALEEKVLPFLNVLNTELSPGLFRGAIHAVRERMRTLADFPEFADFFFKLPTYPAELLVWKKGSAEESVRVLNDLRAFFESAGSFSEADLPLKLEPLIAKYGKGNVLWPLRVSLSGKEFSPDPYSIAVVLERNEVLRRLEIAIDKISS